MWGELEVAPMIVGCLLTLWALASLMIVGLLVLGLVLEVPWLLLGLVPLLLWARQRHREGSPREGGSPTD
jgi:hypothetical protein